MQPHSKPPLWVLALLVFFLPATHALAAQPPGKPAKPNILLILVDDMGFSDISCYGGEIPTPNLDALAAGGLRFTQFYNTGRCCPTRASLLTGLYSHQTGIGNMTADDGIPGYRGFLNDRCVTLADVLRTAGYRTSISGKWHVGSGDSAKLPLAHGFDRFYGVPEGGGFYYKLKGGRTIMLDDQTVASMKNPLPDGWYSTDAWTDNGIRFVDEAIGMNKPFFLYLAHNAPHFPLQAAPEDIAKYRGKYKAGWDKLRADRHARQKQAGLVASDWPLSPPEPQVRAWESLSPEEQDQQDHLMAIYAAVMDRLDRSIGRLTAHLKEKGVMDDTLILFMSDNGGTAEGGVNGKFGNGQPGTAESNVYAGQNWATLENTPYRLYKMYSHEGGISTPLIAHWPNGIKARGELRHQVGHVIDIMPTLVELTGATYPKEHDGQKILPPEGKSLLPALVGPDQPTDRGPLFWEHNGNAAIRAGDWKLSRRGRDGAWELYDLKTDRTETKDLAKQQPAKVKELADQWEAWARRAQVKPYPTKSKGGGE